MTVDRTELAVGDELTVTITYRWPRSWTVARQPEPGLDFRAEFVKDFPPMKELATGDEVRRVFTLTVLATRSGAWALPRPGLTATGPDGERTATAPAVVVQVGTEAKPAVLPAPRPAWVRPLHETAASRTWWWAAAGVAVAAIAAVALLLRRRASAPPPPPHAIAAREFDAALTLADGREAGTRLSLALRRYAGAIWSFDGPGSTTRETAACLRALGPTRVAEGEARELVRLLGALDDLRWAAGDLTPAQVRPLVDDARRWLMEVQRRIDAEAAAATSRPGSA